MPITDTYSGYPILLLPPDLSRDATPESLIVDLTQIEGESGAVSQTTTGALPNTQMQISFLGTTRDGLADFKDFLGLCSGRYNYWWLPTWHDDLWVVGADFGFITIREIGYAAKRFPYAMFRRILIVNRADPTDWWPRYVSSAVDNGDGTETLNGNVGFPYPLRFYYAKSDDYRFMFPLFVRLDSDDVDIEYLDGETWQCTLTVLHTPEAQP